MGLPKTFRSSTYFTSQSIAADATPSAYPVTPIIPPSREKRT